MSDAVTVEIDWNERDYMAAVRAHTALVRNPTINVLIKVGFVAAFVVVSVYLAAIFIKIGLNADAHKPSLIHGMKSTFYSIGIVGFLYSFIRAFIVRRRLWEGADTSLFQSSPWTATMSVHGIDTVGPAHREHLDWSAVSDVRQMRRGIVISLGSISLYPVTDSGLPPNITRAELLERIAAWRAADAF